jgi:hypothetical protein
MGGMPRKRTEGEVAELLKRYEDRGNVTRRAFCQSERVGVSTLGYYLRRQATQPVRLARVRISSDTATGGGRFQLVLANGRRIECGVAELPHLISAAERA